MHDGPVSAPSLQAAEDAAHRGPAHPRRARPGAGRGAGAGADDHRRSQPRSRRGTSSTAGNGARRSTSGCWPPPGRRPRRTAGGSAPSSSSGSTRSSSAAAERVLGTAVDVSRHRALIDEAVATAAGAELTVASYLAEVIGFLLLVAFIYRYVRPPLKQADGQAVRVDPPVAHFRRCRRRERQPRRSRRRVPHSRRRGRK